GSRLSRQRRASCSPSTAYRGAACRPASSPEPLALRRLFSRASMIGCRRASLFPALADAIQMRIGPVDQGVSGDRRRGGNPLAKLVRCQHLELLAGLDDEGLAVVVAQVEVAVAGNR